MTDFLKTMATASAERAAVVGEFVSSDFDAPVVPLTLAKFDVIAEIKDHSPAEGRLSDAGMDREERAQVYASGGAAAISVLTEPTRFKGELSHLKAVVATVPNTPVMRKDFLVEPVQVLEARTSGASGVLLIATMLSDAVLTAMLDCAWEHGMFVLLEAFDEEDLRRCSALLDSEGAAEKAAECQLLIGVNTRNLRTLAVDADRLKKLAPALPNARCVAESGLHTAGDAARVANWGYQLALCGTALMRSNDSARLVREMRDAGSEVLS